jgi:hypothetical protein
LGRGAGVGEEMGLTIGKRRWSGRGDGIDDWEEVLEWERGLTIGKKGRTERGDRIDETNRREAGIGDWKVDGNKSGFLMPVYSDLAKT